VEAGPRRAGPDAALRDQPIGQIAIKIKDTDFRDEFGGETTGEANGGDKRFGSEGAGVVERMAEKRQVAGGHPFCCTKALIYIQVFA